MGQFIEPSALEPFAEISEAKATEMIADAESQAILAAPCIPGLLTPPPDESPEDRAVREAKLAAVKSILRAAILRWNAAGSGTVQTTISGPFSETQQYQQRKAMFYPTEKADLQSICKADEGEMVSIQISSGRTGRYRTEL